MPKKKAQYKHKRAKTAFGFFSKSYIKKGRKGTAPQGPHIVAHVTTSEFMEGLADKQFEFKNIRSRSRLRLSSGQENRVIRDLLKKRRGDRPAVLRQQRVKFVSMMHLRDLELDAATDPIDQAQLFGERFELSSRQTSAIERGSYTHDEIKGKGETRVKAQADLKKASKLRAKDKPGDFKTMDYMTLADKDAKKALKRMGQMGRIAVSKGGDTGSQLSEDSAQSLQDSVYGEALEVAKGKFKLSKKKLAKGNAKWWARR